MKKHYGTLDGLRMIAAFGIVMMHIQANTDYQLSGFIYDRVIPSFTNFTFLFMVISAFGMCCGYYEKVLINQIDWETFYLKRFKKIFPFFSLLVLLDILVSPSINSLYEGFADITLLFGFIPQSMNVIGVGWFIGLVFVFYLIFPFYCVLIKTKKRAWIIFLISLIYNFVCNNYFELGRSNILYSGCFFIAGGLIYLYRNEIFKIKQFPLLCLLIFVIVSYYLLNGSFLMCLIASIMLVVYAVGSSSKLLDNSITHFFSNISLEIYLSHMFIFRILEKLNLLALTKIGGVSYMITVFLVIVGASMFALCFQKVSKILNKKINRRNA